MPRKAVIVGLSGASSSGKTTLARLLTSIFPNSFILHEDDFYKPEEELPLKNGLLDWDAPTSLNLTSLHTELTHIQTHGVPSPSHATIQHQQPPSTPSIPPTLLPTLIARVQHHLKTHSFPPLCFLDGFLLYTPALTSFSIPQNIDIKFFLQVSYAKLKERREGRKGYVTTESGDWWEDPEGYVDKVVWPNYVEGHEGLFVDGDVEGELREDVRWTGDKEGEEEGKDMGLEWFGKNVELGTCLERIVGRLLERLEGYEGGEERRNGMV